LRGYVPALQNTDEFLYHRGIVLDIADEQPDTVTSPLEPRDEGRHRIQVFTECLRLRCSVILDSESDGSPLTVPDTGDQGVLREAKDHIRAHEITVGVETNPLQILLRCLVTVAAVVSQREAPL